MKLIEVCQLLHIFSFFFLVLLFFSQNTTAYDHVETINMIDNVNRCDFPLELNQVLFQTIQTNSEKIPVLNKTFQKLFIYGILALVFFVFGGAFRLGIMAKIHFFL